MPLVRRHPPADNQPTPDDTLALLDGIQGALDWIDEKNGVDPRYNMRDVLWTVIDDILHSIVLAGLADDADPERIYATVLDYVANHYGDD